MSMPTSRFCEGLFVLLILLLHCNVLAAARTPSKRQHPLSLHIAHVNDVHNRLEQVNTGLSACSATEAGQGNCFGGYARISRALQTVRSRAQQEGAKFLFLDAGDELLGTLYDVLFRGRATAYLQNAIASLKPDAQTLGNHEFDFGPERLVTYIKNVSQPFISCNTNARAFPALNRVIRRYVTFTVLRSGVLPVRIAVIGWTAPETSFISSPGKVTFNDIIASVKAAVKDVKREAADGSGLVIIGLSHAGITDDLATAAAVPELDLIIGGHSHTFLANQAPVLNLVTGATDTPFGPYPTHVTVTLAGGAQKSIPVVQAFWASKYLGFLNLTWTPGVPGLQVQPGSEPILLGGFNSSSDIAQDQAVSNVLAPFKAAVDALGNQVVGKTLVALDGARNDVRTKETNLGNLVCDSMLTSIKNLPGFEAAWGETFICIQNGGGVRASIAAGDVTRGQVISVLPFSSNTVSVVRVTGQALINSIINGISGFTTGAGRFPQVTGLRYFHNNDLLQSTSPASVYLFKSGVQQAVDPTAEYNVVTNSFMATGGDNYLDLKIGQQIYPNADPQDQVLANYITAAGDAGVNPQVEGRIINCATITCATETRQFVKDGCSCP